MKNKRNRKKKKYSTSQLQKIGFIFGDKEGEVDLNGNIFAKHILKKYKLVYCSNGAFYLYVDGVYKPIGGIELKKKLRRFLHKYISNFWCRSVESIYWEALKLEAPFVKEFNTDKNILNLKNGILDLRTFELTEHTPNIFSSIRLPIVYDKNEDCPRFKQFLKEVFLDSKRIIKIMQEILGYCLTNLTDAQKAFLLLGNGANGKSTLIHVIEYMCGTENVSSIPISELDNAFKRKELLGKTVNLVSENEFTSKGFQTQYFKAIVSGDSISAEIKFGNSFSFSPFCKIVMAMNHLPLTRDLSDGLKRRLIIIPFDASFKKDKADKTLSKKLEKEIDGIFCFALEGLKRLKKNNFEFTQSKKIDNVLENYFGNVDPLYRFVKEQILADRDNKINYTDLFKEYSLWLRKEGGEMKINRMQFTVKIKERLHANGIPFSLGKSRERYIGVLVLKATLLKVTASLIFKTDKNYNK